MITASSHVVVQILLGLSTILSLGTTVYSVLESYYCAMLTASDSKVTTLWERSPHNHAKICL